MVASVLVHLTCILLDSINWRQREEAPITGAIVEEANYNLREMMVLHDVKKDPKYTSRLSSMFKEFHARGR